MKNLTLKRMMAYVDEDLVEATNDMLIASEIICGEYVALFETEETEFNTLAVFEVPTGMICSHARLLVC